MFLLSSTFCRRCTSTFVDLGAQMKRLNDDRQFKKSLVLFDTHIEKQSSALAANQALKACIQLTNINRGIEIHQNLSSSLINNTFIQTNLIRLYSKSLNWTLIFINEL